MLTLWEDVWAVPAADFWAHLQMWAPQRGFLRDLNKGEMRSVDKRGTPVLFPCIHRGKSSDLAFYTLASLLPSPCSTKSAVWSIPLCHGGDIGESWCVNIDIRWLLATLPVITQFIMPALTATFYWCTCVNTTQNESLTLGTCTNYLSHLVCQGGIGHIWQSYWVSAPGIWNHYSLYWIHSSTFVKKFYFANKSL